MTVDIGSPGGGSYRLMNTMQNLKPSSGTLVGIFVNSAAGSPAIAIFDNTVNSGAQIANIVPVAYTWYPIPANFKTGLTIDLANTTITAIWN